MPTRTFEATAGFHLASGGTDRNVILAEEICACEKQRIRIANEPELTRLHSALEVLICERQELQAVLSATRKAAVSQASWPLWQCIMAVIFVLASLGLTLTSFEPFDLDPAFLWLCCIGISCLCAYATAEFLDKTDMTIIVTALSIILFVASIAGLMTLAGVRGDLFALHLQNIPASTDADPSTGNDNALAFYHSAGPQMRRFLILLSLSCELAGGLALHAVRTALKTRPTPPSAEVRRLVAVENEIGQTRAQLIFLHNEPAAFEQEFRRNLFIGLLDGAARHAKTYGKLPATIAFLVTLGFGATLRAQPIDLVEGLDYSATSKATGYDGNAAHRQNIDAAARIIASLPAGSRVRVFVISDQSFARPRMLLSAQVPESRGRLREYDGIAAARGVLAARVRDVGMSIKPDYQATDILGFLMLAGMVFRDTPRTRHILVVHSDMRQAAPPLDIEHQGVVPVGAALATVERQHLFADLDGVEVFVYGVHAVGKDVAYWQSLRDFWAAYFERSHATLGAFSMMRETPNFRSSR